MMIITISGRSGSGKTALSRNLMKILGEDDVCYLLQDSYYKDRSHIPIAERHKLNFDHPDALDLDLFDRHLSDLKKGNPIEKPVYDYVTHTRKSKPEKLFPKKFILIDGLLVLIRERVQKLADFNVFVDTDPDVCFIRRLLRDTKDRERSVDGVINQYLETVKPMNEQFVMPMKRFADFIMYGGGQDMPAIKELAEMIQRKFKT